MAASLHMTRRMSDDEAAIRDLIQTWMTATSEDPQSVLSLIDDDAIFLGSAPKPYGKKEFAEKQVALNGAKVQGKADVKEVRVDGDWGYAWTELDVTVTPREGPEVHKHGYAMGIYRRLKNDRWVLYRDANMM